MARGATRKRQQVQRRSVREAGRRVLLAGVAVLSGLAFVGLLVLGSWQLHSLQVQRVVITGELEHVDRDAMKTLINGSLEDGFLWLDLQSLRTPLESLPWVHRVVVRRQWPDTIEVRVIEQRAIARWGGSAFLNHAGEVFAPGDAQFGTELPRLAGPEGSHGLMMERYLLVQEVLQSLGLRLSALEMDKRSGLSATLADGSQLLLGSEDLVSKLERLKVLYKSRLADRRGELARVDLRYRHGAAVAWKGATTIQEES
jgi:cell division protein FtsQ